ncbi:MAG: HDOD domain-containing protein [Rhodothermales bacterium]|nr:HDOD domain-containing protein [Rhodothermales bacterium]
MQAITGAIPSPPLLAFKVLKLARQVPIDFGAISRVIATDASLSSALIKHSNSSRHGVRRPITDLSRALVMLGRDVVINIVMVDAMRSLKAATRVAWPGGDDRFWKHSVAVAIAARFVATCTGMPYAEEAFTCGLLHDFGKLVMLYHSSEAYGQLLAEAAHSDSPLHQLEQLHAGHTHAMIGGIVGRQWRLPDSLVHAIEFHHDKPDVVFGTLGNLVRSANLLVKVAAIGHSGTTHVLVESFRLMPHARLSEKELGEMIVGLPAKVDELASYILGTPSANSETAAPVGDAAARPRVAVKLSNEDEAMLVRYLLLSLGYTPCSADAVSETTLPDAAPCAGVVTDNKLTGSPLARQIDYQAWKADNSQPGTNTIDCEALRTWLKEQLAEVVPAAA